VRATTDADRITAWWRRHPQDNVAIATGPAGLVVIDLDVADPGEPRPAEWPDARSGIDVFDALAARNGGLPRTTFTVGTAGGGRHLYYRVPGIGAPWRNTAGRVGWHIDSRAAGGYVVAPGSVVGGHPYVIVHAAPVLELPRWLAALLTAPTSPPPLPSVVPRRHSAGYGACALHSEVQRVLDAPCGLRNAALNRAAWNLGRHVATGLLARQDVEEALRAAGEAAGGQTPAGVVATIRSAIDARLRRDGS
jgi:hypothetical protein